jgi:RNA polymerase sigma-70 factor (ECF subfamily)
MILEAAARWEDPVAADEDRVRLRKGDPDALAEMVVRFQHRLYRYLLRLVRDPTAAEDLFQQTWLRVAESIRRYDARRSFDAWLFAVAHNLAIDHLRRREPRSLDEPDLEGRAAVEVAAGSVDALDQLLAWERAKWIESAMGELPAVYRETLTLRFEEGMKLEDIVSVCHVPLSTVKSRLRRGLEGLRRRLDMRARGESR